MPNQPTPAHRPALARSISGMLAVATVALLLIDPERAGSHGSIMARSAGAMMIVGAIACVGHGLGLRGAKPPVRVLTHPRVAWALVVVGFITSSVA